MEIHKIYCNKNNNKINLLLRVLSMILDHWRKLWKLRNEHKHRKDTTSRRKIKKALEIVELNHIYNKRKTYLAKDKELLFNSIEDHLQHIPNTLTEWLKMHRRIFIQSENHAKKYSLNSIRSIPSYFTKINKKRNNKEK